MSFITDQQSDKKKIDYRRMRCADLVEEDNHDIVLIEIILMAVMMMLTTTTVDRQPSHGREYRACIRFDEHGLK